MVKSISKKTLVLRNKVFTYMLPLLGKRATNFKNCSGAFIGDENNPEIEDKILLLFRMNKEWSTDLHHWITDRHLHETWYEVNDEYRMYVFKIPIGYEHNYELFKQSKYSKLDDELKRHIISFHTKFANTLEEKEALNTIRQVLYRSEELYQEWEERLSSKKCPITISRDQEISSVLDLKVEIFNSSMLEDKNNIFI